MTLTFRMVPDGPAIILSDDVIATMMKHRQLNSKDKEAGGQLFARFEGKDTFIIEATEPKSSDTRKRYWFEPNRWLQRSEIRAKHLEGMHFVGDWHTHPQPIPAPSQDDHDSIVECFQKSRHELKAFLMIIVGTSEPFDGIKVWVVDKQGIKELFHRPTLVFALNSNS